MHRILIIEDDFSLNNTLAYNLRTAGYTVDSAYNAKEAFKYLKQYHYILLILDINLPDGNGFELYSELKEKSNASIIFLTANDLEQKETIYEDGNLCINFSQMTATLDKVPLELSPLEYRILQYFIVNKKHILKRDQLLEHLWDFSENFVGDTSLNTAISRLRKKIEASGHRYIKTIYGTGYMWIGD